MNLDVSSSTLVHSLLRKFKKRKIHEEYVSTLATYRYLDSTHDLRHDFGR
jgi:hypothetical protein